MSKSATNVLPAKDLANKTRGARLQTVATLLVCVLIGGVALIPSTLTPGIDVVTLLVPLALLAAVGLIRVRGLDEIPYRNYGVAASLFLLWALISVLAVGTHSGELMTWVRYLSYFLLIGAVGLIAASSQDRTVIFWALAIAGAAASLYGLYQYLNPSIMSDTFATGAGINVRIYSTFENPNFFSEFLLMTLCGSVALVGVYWKRSKTACGALVALILIQTAALYLTYTRGSWLALAAGIIIAALVIKPRAAAILAGLAVLAGLIPPVFTRLMGVFSGDGSTSFRIGLWKAAFTAIGEKPVFGGGLGDFYQIYQSVVTRHPALYQGVSQFGSHNSYLQLAAETGVLGGLLFFCAVASLVWAAVRLVRRQNSKRRSFQAAALLAGLAAFILNALTSDSFQHPHAAVYFFVVGGLLVGLGAGYWHAPEVFSSSVIFRKLASAKRTDKTSDQRRATRKQNSANS